jgi:DNA-binding transcriptional ArsR family regulator
MSEPLPPREVRDVEELRALAHPMRQRILRRLHESGPATSTTLARDLGQNSGIMSYHLRLLAEHDFVREVAGRGQGRERWWEASPQTAWIPREGLSIEAQAEVSGLRPTASADALEGFDRFRAARRAMGEWGRGTWIRGRTTLTLTREEAVQFIADQQELVGRYQRDAADAPPGVRTVVFASVTYPEPLPNEEPELSGTFSVSGDLSAHGSGKSPQ